jgi:hypothetical protein
MITRLIYALLILTGAEAAWAICAAIVTDTNPYPAGVVLAGAAVAWLVEDTRARRFAAGRAAVWARREREAGRDA